MIRLKPWRWQAILLTLVLGCGESAETAALSGNVTVDGVAVEQGQIVFTPIQSAAAAAAEIRQGAYHCSVVKGKSRVTFMAMRRSGRSIPSLGGHMAPEMVDQIPARYRGGIELEVKNDNANQDFPLTSR